MMRRMCKPVAALCSAALALQGCVGGWVEEHQKTIVGTGIGAAAGAGLGYAVRGKKGAVVGGLLGALAGGIIGNYLESRDRSAHETNTAYNYAPTQGTRVEVAGAAADPTTVHAGEKVYLQATYAIMAPDEQREIPVVETRVVTREGIKVAELSSTVSRLPGTYTSQVPIDLPLGALRGRYELTVSVAAVGVPAIQRSAAFVVN